MSLLPIAERLKRLRERRNPDSLHKEAFYRGFLKAATSNAVTTPGVGAGAGTHANAGPGPTASLPTAGNMTTGLSNTNNPASFNLAPHPLASTNTVGSAIPGNVVTNYGAGVISDAAKAGYKGFVNNAAQNAEKSFTGNLSAGLSNTAKSFKPGNLGNLGVGTLTSAITDPIIDKAVPTMENTGEYWHDVGKNLLDSGRAFGKGGTSGAVAGSIVPGAGTAAGALTGSIGGGISDLLSKGTQGVKDIYSTGKSMYDTGQSADRIALKQQQLQSQRNTIPGTLPFKFKNQPSIAGIRG